MFGWRVKRMFNFTWVFWSIYFFLYIFPLFKIVRYNTTFVIAAHSTQLWDCNISLFFFFDNQIVLRVSYSFDIQIVTRVSSFVHNFKLLKLSVCKDYLGFEEHNNDRKLKRLSTIIMIHFSICYVRLFIVPLNSSCSKRNEEKLS